MQLVSAVLPGKKEEKKKHFWKLAFLQIYAICGKKHFWK